MGNLISFSKFLTFRGLPQSSGHELKREMPLYGVARGIGQPAEKNADKLGDGFSSKYLQPNIAWERGMEEVAVRRGGACPGGQGLFSSLKTTFITASGV